jgi:hypothetical protein
VLTICEMQIKIWSNPLLNIGKPRVVNVRKDPVQT